MSNYIDGFVFPIPRKHLDEYCQVAEEVAQIWKEHGALAYHEYMGDDLKLEGTQSFTEIVQLKAEEVVVFGWVAFTSRESRDNANKKVAQDPRMSALVAPLTDPSRMIFNAERMAYGGFRPLLKTD